MSFFRLEKFIFSFSSSLYHFLLPSLNTQILHGLACNLEVSAQLTVWKKNILQKQVYSFLVVCRFLVSFSETLFLGLSTLIGWQPCPYRSPELPQSRNSVFLFSTLAPQNASNAVRSTEYLCVFWVVMPLMPSHSSYPKPFTVTIDPGNFTPDSSSVNQILSSAIVKLWWKSIWLRSLMVLTVVFCTERILTIWAYSNCWYSWDF